MTLLGIITEKDMLRHICDPKSTDTSVKDLMTRDVLTFHPNDSLEMACACLLAHDFHRIPIIDQKRLVGIISRSDILKHRAAALKM